MLVHYNELTGTLVDILRGISGLQVLFMLLCEVHCEDENDINVAFLCRREIRWRAFRFFLFYKTKFMILK